MALFLLLFFKNSYSVFGFISSPKAFQIHGPFISHSPLCPLYFQVQLVLPIYFWFVVFHWSVVTKGFCSLLPDPLSILGSGLAWGCIGLMRVITRAVSSYVWLSCSAQKHSFHVFIHGLGLLLSFLSTASPSLGRRGCSIDVPLRAEWSEVSCSLQFSWFVGSCVHQCLLQIEISLMRCERLVYSYNDKSLEFRSISFPFDRV